MALGFDEFRTLAMAELDSVHRVARSLAPSATDADDLVQETYLRAIRGWQGFDLRAHGIRPWLLRILHNTHINRAVSRSRERKHFQDQEMDALASPAPAMTMEVDWSQMDGQLTAALQALPEQLRAALVMWALEDLTYREIAEVLEVPIGTVMSRLHRARNQLQQALSGTLGPKRAGRE